MLDTVLLLEANIWSLFSNSVFFIFLIALYVALKDRKAFEFFTSFSILTLIVYLFKYSFLIPRPEPYSHLKDSFPSLHSAIAFFSFYFLSQKLPITFVWSLGIALSRLVLGFHRILDVFVGAFLGFIIPLLVEKNKKTILKTVEENKGELLRKLVHAAYFLTLAFLLIYNHVYFLFFIIISTIFIIIFSVIKEELENPLLSPFNKIFREKEKRQFNFALIYPQILLLSLFNFANKEILLALILAIAIYDSLATLINLFLKNYIISASFAAIFNLLLFLLVLSPKISILSTIATVIADYFSKKFRIDDNYLIPLFVFIVLEIFLIM